jgi:hypothetical protein
LNEKYTDFSGKKFEIKHNRKNIYDGNSSYPQKISEVDKKFG